MAKAVLESEIEKWFEDIPDELQNAFLELQEITDESIAFAVGEDEHHFTVNYPKNYPQDKGEHFFFVSEEDILSTWVQELNEIADKGKISIGDLLTKAAEIFVANFVSEDDEEEEDDDFGLLGGDEQVEDKTPKKKKSKEEMEIERKLEQGEFLEIGSAQATLRIINDLKNIRRQDPKQLGFLAEPAKDMKTGLENLYHWNIKLFGIDKDSAMYDDLQKFKKKTGHDHVLLEMRFSKEYPHAPPFVRVVRPRFQFRTGHVTLGGSICMELLTNSGWNSTNDIESILIQITAELISGGARLDPGSGNNYEYSEHEAWEAFYRAARTHGWNVGGLSRDSFPRP